MQSSRISANVWKNCGYSFEFVIITIETQMPAREVQSISKAMRKLFICLSSLSRLLNKNYHTVITSLNTLKQTLRPDS